MRQRIILAAAAAFALAGCEGAEDRPGPEPVGEEQTGANAAEMAGAANAIRPVDAASLATASQEPVGQYLVDGSGRALYVIEGTGQPQGAAAAQAGQQANPGSRCTGACLGEWPPMLTRGAPQAGQGVDQAKISTIGRDGAQQVTYAGFPLYYYVADREPGQISGHHVHDRWGEWYLLAPQGRVIEAGEASQERALRTEPVGQ